VKVSWQDQPFRDTWAQLEALLHVARDHAQLRCATTVQVGGRQFPVHVIAMGNTDPAAPAVGIFGGVHGLERIGTELVLAAAASLLRCLQWDRLAVAMLQQLRVVFMPLVNPGGLWLGTRANPQGVDLMRNAPVDCTEGAAPLLGGQRLSAGLPWYRGLAGAPLQPEARALCSVVRAELLSHDFALALDCHSGFGLVDRLWFPWAHSRSPAPQLAETLAWKQLLDDTLVHHRYVVEPQCHQYLAHGDLWDHLLQQTTPGRCLLPLTLEMGSWLWVKKNPRQAFTRQGLFNPVAVHRQHRVLRQHQALLDFAMRAALNHRHWCPTGVARQRLDRQARAMWYGCEVAA
jgi:hypothetical protein